MEEHYGLDVMQFSAPSEEIVLNPPAALEPLGTFARAICVETNGHLGWRTVDCLLSIAMHVAVLSALAMLPLFFYQQLRPFAFTRTLLIAPVPPVASPVPKVAATRREACTLCDLVFSAPKLLAPAFRPRNVLAARLDPPPMPAMNSWGVKGGIGNPLSNVLGRLASPQFSPAVPFDAQLIRVGGDLQETHPLYGLSLPYPFFAKAMNVTGRVIMDADIDENGNVERIRRVRGNSLLAVPAMEALQREKFVPALLDGQPTRCTLTVEVDFRLTR